MESENNLQPVESQTLPSILMLDAEAVSALTQEFLSCLWERLRGGLSPIAQHPTSTGVHSPWITSAWTSSLEARLIARLLPIVSMDVTQALSWPLGSTMVNQPNPASPIMSPDSLSDSVLNKALGEFARSDHAYPDLAALNLAQVNRCMIGPQMLLVRQYYCFN